MLFISNPEEYRQKEDAYIRARTAEGRVYSDELLLQLPDVPADHAYFKEWAYRKSSFKKTTDYLLAQYADKSLCILDIGCGNGWMSSQLSRLGHTVTGVDLNLVELQQAEHVFPPSAKLQWIYADILNTILPTAPFDVILLAASCQYFPDLTSLTHHLATLLNKNGEIHLIDSMFYKPEEVPLARQRTLDYYTNLGFPEMAAYYFHHTKNRLVELNYKQSGASLFTRFLKRSPSLEWWIWKKA